MADGVTRRRQVLLLCVLGWTLFVGLSLYKAWSKPTGPMVWVVQELSRRSLFHDLALIHKDKTISYLFGK